MPGSGHLRSRLANWRRGVVTVPECSIPVRSSPCVLLCGWLSFHCVIDCRNKTIAQQTQRLAKLKNQLEREKKHRGENEEELQSVRRQLCSEKEANEDLSRYEPK